MLSFVTVIVLSILFTLDYLTEGGKVSITLVHVAGAVGIMAVFILLMALAKRMQSVGPFFRKVGTIALILVWVFLFTPFFSILGLVITYKNQAQIIESIIFTFIILGLFLLMAFINENIKRFHHESQARTAAVSLKNSLKKEAVRVTNILHTRQIFDNFSKESRNSQISSDDDIPSSLKDILIQNSQDISLSSHGKFISFYQREEFDLQRIKENDQENLSCAKELMLFEECKKKEKQREDRKNNRLTEAQRKATRNLKILQRALKSQRASVVKMKKKRNANQKTKEKCKKFLSRFLSRFNQDEVVEDEDGFVPDKDYNKIKNILKEEKTWKDLKKQLVDNRQELMNYVRSGGQELQRLRQNIIQRLYNPDSECEVRLKEMKDELKEFALNPKEKKDFRIETKLVEFYSSLDKLTGDQQIYWPRVLQLMLFFSLKAQAAFIKALYEFWHKPQNPDAYFSLFLEDAGQEVDCIRPSNNPEFKDVTLLTNDEIPNSSLEDIYSEEDLLKELTNYAGRLKDFREIRDLNMRRKLYLSQIMEYMIQERLHKSMELIFFKDELIVEIINTIRKQRKSDQRRERCMEILLKPITCWADLFEKRSKKFKEYEQNLEEQNSNQNEDQLSLDTELDLNLDRRIVADCKTDAELIHAIDHLLRKEKKDPTKMTQKCKESKLSFILFTIVTVISYFTLISNSLSVIPKLSQNLKDIENLDQTNDDYASSFILIAILIGFGSIFLFAQMYRQIMQVGFRMSKASCWLKFQVFIFKLLYTSLFLPLNKLFLKIIMCDQIESKFRMKIYQTQDPKFFSSDISCYETTTYNVIACLTLLAWLIYFTVGTFVVSKLQFLNRTTPFIVYEGFATMIQLFKFFSVLLILIPVGKNYFLFIVVNLSILSVLLLVMSVYTLMRQFALHPFARLIHTIGIVVLFITNLTIVIYLSRTELPKNK